MSDLDKEHLLQKVVAVSGFMFALLILPVAQYFLVNGRQSAGQEQGVVAGVSTETSVTNASVQQETPAQCVATKQKDLTDLQEWSDTRLAALERDHKAQVEPYEAALPLDPTTDGKEALRGLIENEVSTYQLKQEQIIEAVDAQVKDISARDCGSLPEVP